MQHKSFPKTQSSPRNDAEFRLLKSIGRKIHTELSRKEKPVEWLAFESETSRATIRRIFDADRNIGVVTLDRVARALGYKDVTDFFKSM
jgi:hypothetical protein